MSATVFIACGLGAWALAATATAWVLGRMIRLREERRPTPGRGLTG